MKIVFFGTPYFASEILAFLLENKVNIIAVVTQSDKEKNHLHVADVKRLCQSLKTAFPLFQPEKASSLEFIQQIQALKPDLFVVAAYGKILRKELLDLPRSGAINVHASLLPQYRGAAPMQRALLAGDKIGGVTIMQMNEKMDEGDILDQASLPISNEMNLGDLQTALVKLACPLLLKTIKDIEEGKTRAQKQDHNLATYAPKIKTEEYWIDWQQEAEKIHNRIRAFSPSPGARCYIQIENQKKLLKILSSKVVENESKSLPGTVLQQKGGLIVACQVQALEIAMLQLEGKKAMKAEDFLRGLKSPIVFLL